VIENRRPPGRPHRSSRPSHPHHDRPGGKRGGAAGRVRGQLRLPPIQIALGAREVRAKQVAGGALITLLCARLGCHAARPLAMVPRSAYAAAAGPAAIAVARGAARPACRAEGGIGQDRS
jgi:hypothetical protein